MAREGKRIELRTVDDAKEAPEPVVRLESDAAAPREKPVRLVPPREEPAETPRLDVPARETFEARTHQPGVEALIETELADHLKLETGWGENSAAHKHIPWGWFALIGLVMAGAIAWSLTRVTEAELGGGGAPRAATVARIDEQAAEDLQAGMLIDRIEAVTRAFFKATSVAEKARHVRHAARVRPLMDRYYKDHPLEPEFSLRTVALAPLTIGSNTDFWRHGVELRDGGLRNLVVDASDPAQPLVDWETFVVYQPMPWDEFVRDRPAGESFDFRVFVKQDHFYNQEFADSDQWDCFQLTALDSNGFVFGYAPAGGPISQRLAEILDDPENPRHPVILRLRIPEGLESRNGAVIEELRAPNWLYIEPPDAGS